MFLSLYQNGKNKSDLEACFLDFKIHKDMIALLKKSSRAGNDLHILSGSNNFFVEAVLGQHGLDGLFESIIANEAIWQGDLLTISPWDKDGHNCDSEKISPYQFCDINICKGSLFFD